MALVTLAQLGGNEFARARGSDLSAVAALQIGQDALEGMRAPDAALLAGRAFWIL